MALRVGTDLIANEIEYFLRQRVAAGQKLLQNRLGIEHTIGNQDRRLLEFQRRGFAVIHFQMGITLAACPSQGFLGFKAVVAQLETVNRTIFVIPDDQVFIS